MTVDLQQQARRARALMLAALAVIVVLIAFFADGGRVDVALFRSSDPTTTTSTVPPTFAPIPDDRVAAVRTPTGLVLPVLGGGPGAWEVRTPCSGTAVVDGTTLAGAHVVLDPGHGGQSEPGAVGPNGLVERDVNLDIALRAKALLEAEGAVVVLTRDSNVRVTLQTRSEIGLALRPLIFISIHHNAGGREASPVPGIELYHQFDNAESARFAGLLHEEFLQGFSSFTADWVRTDRRGVRARLSSSGQDFYGMLRRTAGIPAVLSEPMFLSNPSEEALLATEVFRHAEADAIRRAVLRFVRTAEIGSGVDNSFTSDASPGSGGGASGCVDPPLQ